MTVNVKVLAPIRSAHAFPDYISSLPTSSVSPFSEERCDALNSLSQAILGDRQLRGDPASVALAYWLRRANFQKMKAHFDTRWAQTTEAVPVPVGRVFHIAPSNIDTFFVYTWALAFACGNANIVRVSGQQSDVVIQLLNCINRQMEENEDLRNSNFFITYEHDEAVTAMISRWCNHRVIWGGNETVSVIRPLYLNPHAAERIFGSKFSYCVISAHQFNELRDDAVEKLALDFFNDVFWFDQMACSSPHVVFWVGTEEDVGKAVPIFNEKLEKEVGRRQYEASASQAVHRLNFAFEIAASSIVGVDLRNRGFISIRMLDRRQLKKVICGGGLLIHIQMDELTQVADFASEEDQTITHFGFCPSELRQLARLAGAKGVDRLVPIGGALSFDAIWDGFDLISDFVRIVTVLS